MTTSAELLTDSPDSEDQVPLGLAATLTVVTAFLAACGGGGNASSSSNASGSSTSGSNGSNDVIPPPRVTPPTAEQAARFLLQAQFSASDVEIAAVQSQEYVGWLATQMNAAPSITGWDWQVAQGFNAQAFVNEVVPTDRMMWHQLIVSTDTVRKRMALALSEFFVVSSGGLAVESTSFASAQYWDVLVGGALGNFRALLEEITLNPAMGVYLNTRGNKKSDPSTGSVADENYAREVLQLFSIGLYELNLDGTYKLSGGVPIETYTQSDITNLAKVFTGWNLDSTGKDGVTYPAQVRNRMVLTVSLHDTSSATFLGTTIPANTEGVSALRMALDTIFQHANVPPFFCKQLIQRLVTSNPSPAYVARVASIFKNNGSGVRGDLKAVLAAVLLDTEARGTTQLSSRTGGRQREPMLRFIQWARTFSANSPTGKWALGDLSQAHTYLGQSPLRSPSVFNFFRPGYVPPSTAIARQGLVAPEFQLTNESSTAGYLNFMMFTIQIGLNAGNGGVAAPSYTAELALVNNPTDLMNRLNLLMCAGQLSTATMDTIKTAIATISTDTPASQLNRVRAAIFLVMASPEYLIQK